MRADDLRRRGGTGGSGYDGRDSNGLPHSTSSSNRKDPDRPRGKLSWFAQTRSTKGSAGSRTRSQGVTLESHAWDAQSQSSRSAIVLESRSRTMDEGDDEDAETRIGVGV